MATPCRAGSLVSEAWLLGLGVLTFILAPGLALSVQELTRVCSALRASTESRTHPMLGAKPAPCSQPPQTPLAVLSHHSWQGTGSPLGPGLCAAGPRWGRPPTQDSPGSLGFFLTAGKRGSPKRGLPVNSMTPTLTSWRSGYLHPRTFLCPWTLMGCSLASL